MSIPDALAAFAEPSTTTVTILEIKTDAILDSDVWGLRHLSGLSIHPSRKTSKRRSLSKNANVRGDRSLSLSKKATSAIYQKIMRAEFCQNFSVCRSIANNENR
jgi:hypothetical protein